METERTRLPGEQVLGDVSKDLCGVPPSLANTDDDDCFLESPKSTD